MVPPNVTKIRRNVKYTCETICQKTQSLFFADGKSGARRAARRRLELGPPPPGARRGGPLVLHDGPDPGRAHVRRAAGQLLGLEIRGKREREMAAIFFGRSHRRCFLRKRPATRGILAGNWNIPAGCSSTADPTRRCAAALGAAATSAQPAARLPPSRKFEPRKNSGTVWPRFAKRERQRRGYFGMFLKTEETPRVCTRTEHLN